MLIVFDAPILKKITQKLSPAVLRLLLSLFLIWVGSILLPSSSWAEQMVTLLFVNGEKKGEVFVHRTSDGDFLLRPEDLKAAGFREPAGAISKVEGEPHISLRSMTGVSFTFNEQTLTLYINADPSLLPRTSIELASQPQRKAYYPRESSLFLNYDVGYRATDGTSSQGLSLTNELGIRRGDYLFLTDTLYTKDSIQDNFVRLHTSITRDDREELRRSIFGDLLASSGTLGSSVNMGGISFAKVYGMDPYFVTYPTFEFSGQASLPSEVDIYVNGVKVRTERVPPGEFRLRDLAAYGGAGVIEVVVRDSLGREQRYRTPFYAADNILLKKGLHDYSYNIGFLRDEFGRESNRYTKPAVVLGHRYGVSDFLTLGFRGEATKDIVNGGPQGAVRLWALGVLNVSLSGSAGAGTGTAADLSYQYQSRQFNAHLFYQFFSRAYRIIAASPTGLPQQYNAGGGLGYIFPRLGAFSFDLTDQAVYEGPEKRTAAIGYSKYFPGNVTLNATFSRTHDTSLGDSNSFFIGLSYTPKYDLTFSARHETAAGRETDAIQAQKNPPLGEGTSFRALLQRDENPGQPDTYTLNPMLQYNGRHAIIRGEMTAIQNSGGKLTEQHLLDLSGALVFLDGVVALTRPVTDSFAAVKVGDVEGVTVRYSGQDIGKTDSAGRVFITDLTSYSDNLVAFNDKDLPIEYYFPQALKIVSPPLRSGTCLGFVVKKIQPITGMLKIRIGGEVKPVEFSEIALNVGGKEVMFPTGAGGELYIDLSQSDEFKRSTAAEEKSCAALAGESSAFLKPGTYRAAVTYEGRRHTFSLTIPPSTDPMIDLGQVVFDASPETEKEPPAQETPVSEKKGTPPVVREPSPKAATKEPEVISQALAPLPPTTGVLTNGAVGRAPTGKAVSQPLSAFSAPPAQGVVAKESAPTHSATTEVVTPPEVHAGGEMVPSQVPSKELSVVEVYLRFGSTVFASANDKAAMITASRLLKTMPGARIVVEGYADQIGSQKYNLGLSKARALAVAGALRKLGVPSERIRVIKWFGKKRLKCVSLDESCRKFNRRVVIRFVSGF